MDATNLEIATFISAAVGAISALAATIVAVFALNRASQISRTQLFLDLRRSHAEAQAKMDPRYHDESWDPRKDADGMRSLERYWLHALTEWYTTTKLNGGKDKHVWTGFYVPALVGGLRNKPLRIALWEMLYGSPGSSFAGFRKEFGDAIESIYKSQYKMDFRDSLS